MPPKGVSKAVSKRCPECKKQIPVATRLCSCGHQFFEERRRSSTAQESTSTDADDSAPVRTHPYHHSDISADLSAPAPAMLTNKANGANTGGESGKRRSERVKREKPNFYDALEYENQMRKARRERQKDDPQPHSSGVVGGRAKRERRPKNSSPDEDDDDEPRAKEKKRRKKKKKLKKEEEEDDEDIMAGISPYRERSFAFVLADINLKLGLNNPAFIKI